MNTNRARGSGPSRRLHPAVMSWLATRPDAVRVPPPNEVLDALPVFQEEKVRLEKAWRGEVPWADIVLLGMRIARDRGLL